MVAKKVFEELIKVISHDDSESCLGSTENRYAVYKRTS